MTFAPRAPLLVLGVGNPSRGDDALGPLFVERVEGVLHEAIARGELEVLTDFQLQIEHALDLVGRRRVVFVDASVDAEAPYTLSRVWPLRDQSFGTHAMSPAAVLDAHRSAALGEPPEAWVLAIRGTRFELGEDLTVAATANLEAALAFFLHRERVAIATGAPGVTQTGTPCARSCAPLPSTKQG
jgi:hydrogenase maturation protease